MAYENYATASTAEARFCRLFQYNQLLRTAPELPASTLADWCYFQMFNGCTSLSSITMLATNVSAPRCLENWLKDAGTNARSRTLTVADSEAYGKVESYLPDNWKQGAEGTTVKFN